MKKLISLSAVSALMLAGSLNAFGLFDVDIDQSIKHNNELIKEYRTAIDKLEKQNKYMMDEKAKHPELYVKKPLYENLKDKYIYRIKLDGASPDAVSFMIKDNVASVQMNMKREQKSDNGYYYSSQYFSTSYAIGDDVVQDKITHKVDGDYFVIEMPKKK